VCLAYPWLGLVIGATLVVVGVTWILWAIGDRVT
jgi:hypothetical protein